MLSMSFKEIKAGVRDWYFCEKTSMLFQVVK